MYMYTFSCVYKTSATLQTMKVCFLSSKLKLNMDK